MAKPVLLTVDDDPGVSRAIERDLRRRFGSDFRVLRAESGEQGLDLLNKLKLRDDRVALLLADQRMPRMTGVEFLERAIDVYPEAKRALLTAYADTEAAIKAINDVDLDRYLMKPWDPPEQHLYPAIDDLIDDWERTGGPREEGVRVVGHRWSRESHELRDFLARNLIPWRWLEIDSDEARTLLEAAGVADPALPTAVFTDGTVLEAPAILQVAEKLGLATQAKADFYDLVIVGGGPAGLAAAVYGASEGLRTVLVERDAPGGQAGQSSRIENYLGFPSGLTGSDLAQRGYAQARRFGAEILAVQTVERLGLRTPASLEHYDLAVVGGGPAGLGAAVYGASEGLRTVMIERDATGGQAGQSSRIENYLGFPSGLSGSELASRATMQARRLGAEMLTVQDVSGLIVEGSGRILQLSGGTQLSANCVLIASGVSYRQVTAPGFQELTGAGIYYGAAMTEARACSNQRVVIIGGANSAGQAAVYFSRFAREVLMLVRGPSLARGMSAYLIEQIEELPNVEVRTGAQAVGAEGRDGHLWRLRVRSGDGQETLEEADACFVFIGAAPHTDWLDGVVARDERGFILAGPDVPAELWPLKRDPYLLETSVPGVFVAGDVRARSIKRVASAVGEGAMAVSLIHEYLASA